MTLYFDKSLSKYSYPAYLLLRIKYNSNYWAIDSIPMNVC